MQVLHPCRISKGTSSFSFGSNLWWGKRTGKRKRIYHGAYLEFLPGSDVELRVGTSFISLEQARANLHAEIPNWDFAALRTKLHRQWQEKLSHLQISGAPHDELVRLYTAFYRTQLFPRSMTEDGRYYSGMDDAVHNGVSYTGYSMWDTFRAEWSWLTLTSPEHIDGMVTALLNDYKEGGWLPKWPNLSYTNIMIGTHADSLVAEAVRKGFHGFDRETAWQAVLKDATVPPDGDTRRRWKDREEQTPYEARAGLTYYLKLGYVPTDKTDEAASNTIEGSYDDWCVAQIAKALGKPEYGMLMKHSLYNRNLYNPALHLMNGKKSDGSWAPIGGPGRAKEVNNRSDAGWTEGDAWVYTWGALHDQGGLIGSDGRRGITMFGTSTNTLPGATTTTTTNPAITISTCTTSSGERSLEDPAACTRDRGCALQDRPRWTDRRR